MLLSSLLVVLSVCVCFFSPLLILKLYWAIFVCALSTSKSINPLIWNSCRWDHASVASLSSFARGTTRCCMSSLQCFSSRHTAMLVPRLRLMALIRLSSTKSFKTTGKPQNLFRRNCRQPKDKPYSANSKHHILSATWDLPVHGTCLKEYSIKICLRRALRYDTRVA